jgi:hypothetical protein
MNPASKHMSVAQRVEPGEAQVLARAINEEIRVRAQTVPPNIDTDVVCECMRPGCVELLRVSSRDYEDVRRFPTRFLVKSPGHVERETERIVEEHGGFVVIEKTGPDAGSAIRRDPRRTRPER